MSEGEKIVTLAISNSDAEVAEALKSLHKLKEGGGGGKGGGMEARVAKLEATVDHMAADVGQLKTDTRDLRDRMRAVEVKVDHLPSKGFIVAVVLVALAVIAALIGYADQLQALRPTP